MIKRALDCPLSGDPMARDNGEMTTIKSGEERLLPPPDLMPHHVDSGHHLNHGIGRAVPDSCYMSRGVRILGLKRHNDGKNNCPRGSAEI